MSSISVKPRLEMKYFVLKPRGDDRHAVASRAAMRMYARSIRTADPELARELREWANRELSIVVQKKRKLDPVIPS